MKKYKTFSEHGGQEFFGETLGEGILRCGKLFLPMATEPTTGLKPIKILGAVDTSSSTRGGKPYEAVVVELKNGSRLQVDATNEEIIK